MPQSHIETWKNALLDSKYLIEKCLENGPFMAQLVVFSNILTEAYRRHANVFICGNGGSHCDSLHFAEELTGRYRNDRPALGALALGEASHTTCVSNDYGFGHVFSRQLSGLGRSGDVLIGLSTSGNSQNVLEAFVTARHKGIQTISLLGRGGGRIKEVSDLALVVPEARTSDRIQEVHIKLLHIVIETVERDLFPENY